MRDEASRFLGFDRATKCFVCAHVKRNERAVDFVLHEARGEKVEWQFICGGEHPSGPDTWAIATVGDVLLLDPALRVVLDLPHLWEAVRIDGTWTRRDYFKATMLESIAEHGFYIVAVNAEGDLPAYVFTVGLWRTKRHPELLMAGGTHERMADSVGKLGEAIVAGASPIGDRTILRELERPLAFLKMQRAHYEDWLGAACGYYEGDDFEVLQIVMADPAGLFPWEKGVEPMYVRLQPLLGAPPRSA